jgi:transposase
LVEVKEELRLTKEELRLTKEDNEKLKARIIELSHKKNSSNSSLPPSTDIQRTTKSLRQKSGKKTGGQTGHEGTTLEFHSEPEVIDHIDQTCPVCGTIYIDVPTLKERRQVLDIPPIAIQAYEHRVYERRCSCGACCVSSFPDHVKSPISYGRNIETLCGYFSARQYVSVSRIREMFADVFNLNISEGTIVNKIKSLAQRCMPQYEEIQKEVQQSSCVGTDETGGKVNGKLRWLWAWQTRLVTFIVVSSNRGFETIEKYFGEGFVNTILVHDCWKAHFIIGAKGRQICLSHILRELQYFIEKRNKWAYELTKLIWKALALKKIMLTNAEANYETQINQIEKTLNHILNKEIHSKDKKLHTLQKRLNKHQQYLLTFLKVMEVPPDNNFSEQAIRNVKVKLKVSGQFRSDQGASYYAVLRSVIDTAIKRNLNVLQVLANA